MTSSSSMDQLISAILGSDTTHLETLILDLMTPSNEQRSQAEFLFNSCKEDRPDNLVVNLADLLEHSPRLDVRAMSAILLGNLYEKTYTRNWLYHSLLEMTQSRVKRGLLNCVVNEQNKPIIKILGNTISKLAADNGWPELMTFMFNGFASVDFWLQESALLIFAQLGAQYVGDSLVQIAPIGAQLAPRLHDVFMDCLGNGGSADVRIAALSAVINFIQCFEDCSDMSSDMSRFEDLLPRMLQCVPAALNPGNEATAQKALVLLIELAGKRPSFFEGRERVVEVVEVVDSMLQIAKAESLEEGTRHLAIEFVITLAEEKICDLPQLIINRLCAILMRMLLDIEDEGAWHSAENEDEDAGRSSNYIFGKECLHRLVTALGGNTIVPVAYEYLSTPKHEWQKHLAGLVALAQIAPSKLMNIPNWEQVVTMVLNSFEYHPDHPRVRWAAINAIGQLSTYVGPSLLDQYHNRVLPALDSALQDDVQNPRVQVEIPNLEQVVTMVLNSFEYHPDHPRVRWTAINAIGQLSTSVGPSLLDQYHNRVLPALDSALGDVQNPRVQACAASAVFKIKIRATCPTHILEPYRDGILSKLIVLPQTGRNIEVLRLANSLKVSTNVETRRRSAILLGEMFEEDREDRLGEMLEEPLASLTKHLVRYILLKCVKEERERSVLKRLCHTIAMFHNAFHKETGWQELICFVKQCVTVDSGSGQNLSYNDLLEAAMLILGPLVLPMYCYPQSLVEYYVRYLENANSTDIKIAAFSAAIGYIRCTNKVMDGRLVPAMTRVLTEGLNEGEEVTTQKALKLLIEWAHQIKHPLFFESYYRESYETESYFSGSKLVGFVSSAIEIAESQCLKETKHLAIDFMITLGERRNSHHELMTKLFGILMSDIENEAASHWADNEDDDVGELRNCSVILKFLDRLAFILDKDSVSWRKLEQYLGAEWQQRVIAINILAQISKVYLKVTKKSFDQLVTMVLDLFQDSHHRVRLAAIHATGQLSADLDPNLQLQYHRLVLAALAEAIYDFKYPQVQKHAASAVINISKNYPLDTLTPDLVKIVGTLLKFRNREDIASDQTRMLAIKNLLKRFRAELPPDTWALTWSHLLDHQEELLMDLVSILA